jgi:hypothetical protein
MEYLSSKKLQDRCSYKLDYQFDSEMKTVNQLGRFLFSISPQEIQGLIDKSGNFAYRLGQYGRVEGIDFTKTYAKVDPEIIVFKFAVVDEWAPPVLQRIVNLFELESAESQVNVQIPGQVWNLHVDKLQRWNQDHPERVMRIVVHLTAWEPGHFWNYGNNMHSHWQVGDVHTFDWMQIPHSTANAGLLPRLSLQITGTKTEKTDRFLQTFKANSPWLV